jgi:AAA+ ATPase superfamily predicted ATPase
LEKLVNKNWLPILEITQATLSEQIKQLDEIPQAYIIDGALDYDSNTECFYGRQEVFRTIENLCLSMNQAPIFLLYGEHGSGKTSLLKSLPKHIAHELVPLLLNVQKLVSTTTTSDFVYELVKQIMIGAFHSRRLYLTLTDFVAMVNKTPMPTLEKWFIQKEKKFSEKRLLLCLDEFEYLQETSTETQSRVLFDFLREVMQQHPRWILLCSSTYRLEELADYWRDYLTRQTHTQTIHLSNYLSESEIRTLIQKPVNEFPEQVFESTVVDAIIYHTHCQPYQVQLLCSIVVEQLNREKRRQATIEDVMAALPKVIKMTEQNYPDIKG